jgi:hypothetical protein
LSPAVTLSVHWWRGIGPEVQANLFYFGFRLGFATISVERESVMAAYRVLRDAMAERVAHDREGR